MTDSITTLRCECRSGERTADLSISDEWRPAAGPVRIDGQSWQLELQEVPGYQVLASPSPGFLIRSQDEALVAAIETLHPGRSWHHPVLPAFAREPLACRAAGLLLSYPD